MSLEASSAPSQQQSAPQPSQSDSTPQSAPAQSATLLGGGNAQQAAVTPASNGQQPTLGHNGGPDWRAMLAGEDAKALERLARYNTPTDVTKALIEAQTKLSQRAEPPKLPENATPQQIAEWRKGLGVPDLGADAKAEAFLQAYKIAAPQGYELSQVESGMLEGLAKLAYEKGHSPREVKDITDFYFKSQAENKAALEKIDSTKQKEWVSALREEWGRDFEAKVAAGEQFLNQRFAGDMDAKTQLLNAQLPGGGKLGDSPQFVKLIAELAMANGMTDRIEANALESNGKSLAEQQRDIEALMFKDPAKYNLPATQANLTKILELRQKRGEIDEIGNPIKKRRSA